MPDSLGCVSARRTAMNGWSAFLIALLLPLAAMAQNKDEMLKEPAKEIPVPNTVSPQLRGFIKMPIPQAEATPTTAEGWKALQKQADAEAAKISLAAAAFLGTKIEPTTVGGVPC